MNLNESKIKVLIVDDNAEWRRYLSVLLAHPCFSLAEAGDGNEALEHLEKFPCDVVITDTEMPQLNGIALTKKIRENYVGVSVVLQFAGKLDPKHPMSKQASICGANLILTKDEVDGPLFQFLMAMMKNTN